MTIRRTLIVLALAAIPASPALAAATFDNTVLVANRAEYNPTAFVDPLLVNPWGIALRPPGAGGHIWASNARSATTTLYIGDANGVPLHQDGLKVVPIDGPLVSYEGGLPQVTGQVYNAASDIAGQPIEFPISGHAFNYTSGTAVDAGITTGPAKFVFVTKDGTINAWRSNTGTAMDSAVIAKDYSDFGADSPRYNPSNPANPNGIYTPFRTAYTGVAMTTNAYRINDQGEKVADNRLYVTDFQNGRIQTFNNQWQEITAQVPFEHTSFTSTVQSDVTPGAFEPYYPWNIQELNGRLFVAYGVVNKLADEPAFDVAEPGVGHVVEYDHDGHIIREFADEGLLNSPWGLTIAPQGFGDFGGDLLVANFGDGTIAAFNPDTGVFHDYLRDANGDVLTADGIWGLTFGNGVSLGDALSLYYTAGPNLEQDGVLGRIKAIPEPGSLSLLPALSGIALGRRRRCN